MRGHLLAFLLFAPACSFDRSGQPGNGAPDADINAPDADTTAPDADLTMPDAPAGCVTWPAPNVDPCDPLLPDPEALTVNQSSVYDTDTGSLTSGNVTMPPSALLTQQGGAEVRAMNLSSFQLGGNGSISVVGSRPLVIIVHGGAQIDGTIAVGARGNSTSSSPGPGGNSLACGNATGSAGNDADVAALGGGGGGGGGAYGDDGGDGGDGQGAGHGSKGGKGTKNGAADLEPLRGGCAGGGGGDDGDILADSGGRAGDGGGAVEITVLGMLSVGGTIDAAGTGGGTPAGARAGGGGGGSGGAILLDGETVTVLATAKLCANGGAGGEGGQLGEDSEAGDNGTCSETTPAVGGNINADGGDGGDGGVLGGENGQPGTNGASNGGGGGGGGGVGRIRVNGRTNRTIENGSVVSPAPV
jgi:hypothetical protein